MEIWHNVDIYDEIELIRKVYPNISSVTRFSTRPRIRNENLAEHSFHVTYISMILYNKYKGIFKINFEKLMTIALIHDFDECKTGDMVYDMKYMKKHDIKFDKIKIIREIFNDCDNKFTEWYDDYLERKSVESILVKIADWVSMLLYVENEVKMGNKHMEDVIGRARTNIMQYLEKLYFKNDNKKSQ